MPDILGNETRLPLCLFAETTANVWKLFYFVNSVFNQLRLLCPAREWLILFTRVGRTLRNATTEKVCHAHEQSVH